MRWNSYSLKGKVAEYQSPEGVMAAANMESHKVAILPCGTVVEAMNGGSVDISRRPGPLLFLEKRLNDPCVDIWTTGGVKLSVDIDRLRNGLDSLETQCPHER